MRPASTIPTILGATASNKTSVGIILAKEIEGEVISVDSRKVYQGLPVGTATPKGQWNGKEFLVEGVPHHLMGFLNPDQPYTAGDFARDAELLINRILERGKVPILVGGTGFYFKALQKGLPQLPNRDEAFRDKVTARIEKDGLTSVYEELKTLDPVAAQAIGPADPHKIIRALEVTELTGQPFSSWKEAPRRKSAHEFTVMGLHFQKEVLEKRIEMRSRQMVEKGMIEETAAVLNQGYSKFCPALLSFGYREAVEVVEGILPRDQFLDRLIKGTKAYAKRQRTWFRTQVQPTWFDCDENPNNEELAMKMKAFWKQSN